MGLEKDEAESNEEKKDQLAPNLKLLRKGTIQPNFMKLNDKKKSDTELDQGFNYKRFISRKGMKAGFGIEGVVSPKGQKEDPTMGSIKMNWVFDFISCLELVVKETNTKQIMNKYCNTFKDLLEVERVHILRLNQL